MSEERPSPPRSIKRLCWWQEGYPSFSPLLLPCRNFLSFPFTEITDSCWVTINAAPQLHKIDGKVLTNVHMKSLALYSLEDQVIRSEKQCKDSTPPETEAREKHGSVESSLHRDIPNQLQLLYLYTRVHRELSLFTRQQLQQVIPLNQLFYFIIISLLHNCLELFLEACLFGVLWVFWQPFSCHAICTALTPLLFFVLSVPLLFWSSVYTIRESFTGMCYHKGKTYQSLLTETLY